MSRIVLPFSVSAGLSIGWQCGSWAGIMGSYLTAVVGAAGGLYLGKTVIGSYLDGD